MDAPRVPSPIRLGIALMAAAACSGSPAAAHAPLQERIAAVSAQIRPGASASLRLQRAELYRRNGELAAAREELSTAETLGAPRDSVVLVRAAVELDDGQGPAAARLLRSFDDSPLVGVHLLAARVASRCGDPREELRSLERALRLDPRLDPEVHRRRVELILHTSREDLARALDAAEFGLEALGDVPALLFLAADIEERLGRPGAALRRLERLEPFLGDTPFLLARRGDLLRRAGRELDAEVAYTEALVLLEERRAAGRHVPADTRLETQLRAALRRETRTP